MGVEENEVVATVQYPEVTYPSPSKYGPGRAVSVAGRLAVVHSVGDDVVVITVLWRGESGRYPGVAA